MFWRFFFYKSHKIVFSLFSITLGNGKSHKEIWTNCNKLFFYACRLFEPVQSGCRQLMVLTTKCQVICGDSPSLQHIVAYTVRHFLNRSPLGFTNFHKFRIFTSFSTNQTIKHIVGYTVRHLQVVHLKVSRIPKFQQLSKPIGLFKKKYTNSWIYAVRTSIETLQSGCYIPMHRHELLFHEDLIFSNFCCRFLNSNYFFQLELKLFYLFVLDLNLKETHSVTKIGHTFHC